MFYHLQEGFNSGPQLSRIFIAVIGLNPQQGDTLFLQPFFHFDGFISISVTELEIIMYYTIHLIFFSKSDHIVRTFVVRSKTGAMDVHVTVGDCLQLRIEFILSRFHQIAEESGTGAGLLANDYAPVDSIR